MLILPGLANLTVSSLTSLPSPAKPDFCECDKWYSNPWAPGHNILPTLVDCVDAWGELPKGSEFMLWHTKPAVGDPYGLPLIVSSDSCQIKIFASGKCARENNLTIAAAPDEIRRIALYTIEECVHLHSQGGYTTKYFANTIDWITAPATRFPGRLNLPSTITHLTAMVWNPKAGMEDYDPGIHDPRTTTEIMDALSIAAGDAKDGPILRKDIVERWWYITQSAEVQENEGREVKRAWWES